MTDIEWIEFEDKKPEDETAFYWVASYNLAPKGPFSFEDLAKISSSYTHYMQIRMPRNLPPKPRPKLSSSSHWSVEPTGNSEAIKVVIASGVEFWSWPGELEDLMVRTGEGTCRIPFKDIDALREVNNEYKIPTSR